MSTARRGSRRTTPWRSWRGRAPGRRTWCAWRAGCATASSPASACGSIRSPSSGVSRAWRTGFPRTDPARRFATRWAVPYRTGVSQLRIGLAYDLFGSYPLRPGAPPDAEVEYEPEATVLVLEAALRRLGHESIRLGNPHAVLRAAGQERLPRLDAVLTIAEGYGPRNREAWVPALCEMAGIPALGSDGLTLSTTLDKVWAHRVVAAAGVPVPAHR